MSVIDELNKVFSNRVEETRKAVLGEDSKDPLDFYKMLKSENKATEVVFDNALADGTLTLMDPYKNEIILPLADGVKLSEAQLFRYRGYHIGTPVVVTVERIDEENHKVYVKRSQEKSSIQQELNSEIFRRLESKRKAGTNEPIIVSGRIFAVNENMAFVDIYNKRIVGVISRQQWNKGYTRNMKSSCKVGAWYDFEVLGKDGDRRRRSNHSLQWNLSRKNISSDPWENIPDSLKITGNTLVVKCVEVPKMKSYWWGVSERVEGVEIMGAFNDNADFRLREGVSYKCKIRKVDPENKKFRVVPYEVADTNGGVLHLESFMKEKKENVEETETTEKAAEA